MVLKWSVISSGEPPVSSCEYVFLALSWLSTVTPLTFQGRILWGSCQENRSLDSRYNPQGVSKPCRCPIYYWTIHVMLHLRRSTPFELTDGCIYRPSEFQPKSNYPIWLTSRRTHLTVKSVKRVGGGKSICICTVHAPCTSRCFS